jgi:signal transduction histidine kinase
LLYARTIESEQNAKRAIAAREQLVAVVSHDLKSPLSTISMTTSGLLHELPAQQTDVRRALERIGRSADRMGRLIRDLLDLARLEGGRLSIAPRSQEVTALLTEVVELFRAQAAAKSLRLEPQKLAPEAEWACFDRERILQVLANLVGNAVKFTPAGGQITLEARRVGREVILSVRDTGPGISEDERDHVFDRYWQANETAQQGTGLGLSIAKGLVELHGGRIWVASQPGTGSTFSFSLPAE